MTDKELCRQLMAGYWEAHSRPIDWPYHRELSREFSRRFGQPWTARIGEVPPARFGEDLDD